MVERIGEVGSEVRGGGGGGLVEKRRGARLRDMVEMSVVDDRSEGDVESVKVDEHDEGEIVKVEEDVALEDEEDREDGRKVEKECEGIEEETIVLPFRREGFVKVEGDEMMFSADGEVFMDGNCWLNGRHEAEVKLEVTEEDCIEVKLEEGIIEGVEREVLKWPVEEKGEGKFEVGCGDAVVKRGGRGIGYGGTGGWGVRRSLRLQEMKERDEVEVEETGEAYGKLVKLEETTGQVYGDTCEVEKFEEEHGPRHDI